MVGVNIDDILQKRMDCRNGAQVCFGRNGKEASYATARKQKPTKELRSFKDREEEIFVPSRCSSKVLPRF